MSRKIRYLAVVGLSLLMLAVAVVLYAGRVVHGGFSYDEGKWDKEPGQIYALLPMSHFRQETISLWWSEKEEKYYLFLPSFWEEGSRIRFCTVEGSELALDGEKLSASGKWEGVREGVHSLTVDGTEYELEVMHSQNIPALFVGMSQDKKEALYDTPYIEQYGAAVKLVDNRGNVCNEGGVAGFRVRGNTSADWVKKPYQMTMAQSTDFLGMGGAVKWNLLSNWSDKTLLRNKITYDMAAQAGMPYSPDSAFVDLYLNGEYQGCYQLCEKVEIGPERVAIRNLEDYTLYEPTPEELAAEINPDVEGDSMEERIAGIAEESAAGIRYRGYDTKLGTEDVTGGYLLEVERPSRIHESASFFVTRNGQPVTVKRPKYADKSEVEYIGSIWQTFEDALFAEDGINPGTGRYYIDYIDEESFVKKYLVEEIVRNYDASSTSQYFYKPDDGVSDRIYAGPVWDYDMSLGNPIMNPATNQHYISSVSPYGLFAALPMDDFSIWYRLYEKADFRQAVVSEYAETFLPLLKQLENGGIDGYAEQIRQSALLDGVRWGRNKGENMADRVAQYEESLEQLKEFVSTREYYLTGLWVDGRESKKVYLDGGDADMYISYVEGLVGDCLEVPLAPEKEGYTFVRWLNGYTKEPYDFGQPYDGSDLYFVAEYTCDADGSVLVAGEE